MNFGKHSLVLCGGGIDSYVAAWDTQLSHPGERIKLLYIDYGAKARTQEINATEYLRNAINERFGPFTASVAFIEFNLWSKYLNSPLTSDDESINLNPRSGRASEWVPARNTVLMAVALSIAEDSDYARIVCGINKTAAVAYPDNDNKWLQRYQALAEYAVNKERHIDLVGPLAELEKVDIITLAYEIGMTQEILGHSWSCYKAYRKLHCGECSSCRARKTAFRESLWSDPTRYTKN